MALPAPLSPSELTKLDKEGLWMYFCQNARYTDSPDCRYQYAIRLGSKTIWSNDTYDLREKFVRAVGRERRKPARNAANREKTRLHGARARKKSQPK